MSERERPVAAPEARARAIRESAERMRPVFELGSTGFALVALDGRFQEVNRLLCEMVGYQQLELLAMTDQALTHPDDRVGGQILTERLLAGDLPVFQIEKRYIHGRGHAVWVLLAMSVVRDAQGAPLHFLAQMTDVAARRETEQSIARHAAELERSNADLEQFAYVASHDLQEPLRAIASYAALLAESYRGRLDERADRWIGFIVAGADRMQRLVDDLLTLARVRMDGTRVVPTNLGRVVTRTWDMLYQQYPGVTASLRCAPLPTIDANPAQMDQLFQNLLGNSFKYRQPMAPLVVQVTVARRENGGAVTWELTVRDNGIGLDMVHAERIFDIFERLHRDEDYEGTGIGLAICRRIVERHGGRIWVESAPGHGAAFLFTLLERPPAVVA